MEKKKGGDTERQRQTVEEAGIGMQREVRYRDTGRKEGKEERRRSTETQTSNGRKTRNRL